MEAAQKNKGLVDGSAYEHRPFEVLQADFQQVLRELSEDKALERFRLEYEKLFKAIKKSHDNEARLTKKCRELNAEIVSNAAKVQTALKLSEEDQQTIIALKKEIEKAWKLVDSSHEKEVQAKQTIQALKAEIANLSRLAESGTAMSLAEDATLAELMRQKEELLRERDVQVDQIMSTRTELLKATEDLRRAEADKLQLEGDIATLKQQYQEKKSEAERELRKKERLEKDARDLRGAVDAKNTEICSKQLELQGANEQIQRLEVMIREAKSATERVQKEYSALNEKMTKLHHDLDEQVHVNTQLLAENSSKQVELKNKQEELAAAHAEVARIVKMKDGTLKKVRTLEEAQEVLNTERDTLKIHISSLEREVDSAKRAAEFERKKTEELARERDILNKLRTQADSATQKQVDLVKVSENSKRNLEQEAASYRAEAQRAAKTLASLEKEREKLTIEASDASAKYLQALEEVKLREVAILELQKRISEGEGRLKQQQALYEAVRADRNLYSKSLIESQDEIAEMKRKFKIMGHQIEQLKEEISAKDLALVKEHFDHMKVEKEKEALRMELTKSKSQIQEADEAIAGQKAQLEKLNHVVAEADAERVRQKKELDLVLSERDILGTQLIRRNDELALLYEKIKIQQSTLSKGQMQYRDRLNEIRVLKIKLADLRRELHVLRTGVANVDVLKREVAGLGRALLAERTKVRALSEELENPLNVHRWRKLEGSDPSTYEMIQKIQTLQKRLIARTEEVVERDLLIQEKEKLYVELKNILARQPGPEVAEQLSMYQGGLREKTKQLKAMASELNMYQVQVSEYKYEIDRLNKALTELKRKYFESKKREQLEKEANRSTGGGATGSKSGGLAAGGPRYTGGGFNLSAAPGSIAAAAVS